MLFTTPSGAAYAALPAPTPPAARQSYTPVVPARLLDTRPTEQTVDGLGRPKAPLGAASRVDVTVLGRGGVPATGVSAVVLNVTAVNPTTASFLTVWPTGATRPTASNLNFGPGDVIPNLVIAKVGAGGQVSIFNRFGDVDVVVDLSGYFPAADAYVPLVPARVLETRAGLATIDGRGRPGAPLGPSESLDLELLGRAGVPSTGVSAVVLNVTATNVTGASFLTLWPSGAPRPIASNLNLTPGTTRPNLVIVKVGKAGSVSVFNAAGTADVVADLAGYFPTDGAFVPLQPARILETRPDQPVTPGGVNMGARLGGDYSYSIDVTGLAGIPASGVSAVVLNVTAIHPGSPSYVTVWPSGADRPKASNLNLVGRGEVVPNLVVVKVGAGGNIDIYNRAGTTDLAVDVAGYFRSEIGNVREIVTDQRASCALFDIGTVSCWGEAPQDTQLLYRPANARPYPYQLGLFDDAVDMAVDWAHSCVIRQGGSVWCWSSSGVIPLAGDGSVGDRWPPVRVPGLSNVVAIDTGYLQTCALVADGTVSCWGASFVGAPAPTPKKVPGLTGVIGLEVGSESACALDGNGRVSCWGRLASTGVLGDGSGQDSITPVQVAGLTDATSVTVQGLRACATRRSGQAVCWGNSFLGDGTVGRSMTPVVVRDSISGDPVTDIVQIDGGDDYACVLRQDDQVYCWGSSSSGRWGLAPDPWTDTTSVSVPVVGLPPIASFDATRFHLCAVALDGDVYCWGDNSSGQLGDGTFETRTSPTLVSGVS